MPMSGRQCCIPVVGAGAGLSAAQVANQVRLRAREAVSKYYEGTLVSDDEVMPVTTRNICLRAQVYPNTCLVNVDNTSALLLAMLALEPVCRASSSQPPLQQRCRMVFMSDKIMHRRALASV